MVLEAGGRSIARGTPSQGTCLHGGCKVAAGASRGEHCADSVRALMAAPRNSFFLGNFKETTFESVDDDDIVRARRKFVKKINGSSVCSGGW